MKNVLIVSSLKEVSSVLSDLFSELEKKDYFFYLFFSRTDFLESFKASQSRAKKTCFGPGLSNNFLLFLFLLLLPFFYFFYFFFLLALKYKKGIKTLICLSWNEKIIFSPLATILKIEIIWLEFPEINYKERSPLLLFFYRALSRRAEIVIFSSLTGVQLKNLKFSSGRIKSVLPGIKFNQAGRQETIFSSLAKAEPSSFSQKYFTLGIITDFLFPNQIENLFQAVKICLTIIPNLQLIVVGETNGVASRSCQEKKLGWLAKKIGINNLVWFVRDQDNLKKWLDSFDIFVIIDEIPTLDNLNAILRVMRFGLPIVGFRNRGFEDIILEKETGLLIEADNSEILAQQIMGLYNNERLRANLARNAREAVEKNFNIDEMVRQFESVLISKLPHS